MRKPPGEQPIDAQGPKGLAPRPMLQVLPILLLLTAVLVVLAKLPKVDLGHSPEFKRRRVMNWIPLGLTYAFLYFGRYNLSAIVDLLEKDGLLTKAQFGDIDAVGAYVYGVAFLINGPLTDKYGGRLTMLIAAAGSAMVNVAMALAISNAPSQLATYLLPLNALNMYFQSFGAVSIVKVNAPWFHVRERGVLGALFGILISLGLYFSYDWSLLLARNFGFVAAFWVPAGVLATCWLAAFLVIRDSPKDAGFADFDTGAATFTADGQAMGPMAVAKRMFSQRVIWIIVAIEFCSGFLRQAVMKWYRPYARAIGEAGSFVYDNWGMLLCIAGILGGVFAGFISDYVFDSRRGPVASVLYAGLRAGALLAVGVLGTPLLGWSVVFMSLCVIGVHGMLSGTASADFGGTKNAGLVTGIIDGFVYLGTGTQALIYGRVLPKSPDSALASNWIQWPGTMIPVAVLGLFLCTRVWNARPQKQ